MRTSSKRITGRLKNFLTVTESGGENTLAILGGVVLSYSDARQGEYLAYYLHSAKMQRRLAALYAALGDNRAQYIREVMAIPVVVPGNLASHMKDMEAKLRKIDGIIAQKEKEEQLLKDFFDSRYADILLGEKEDGELPKGWLWRRLSLVVADSRGTENIMLEKYSEYYLNSCLDARTKVNIPLPPVKEQRQIIKRLKRLLEQKERVVAILEKEQETFFKFREALLEELFADAENLLI
jgi:hypothetical protein